MAYTTIDENRLIIHGGSDFQNSTFLPAVNQFWSLDLTRPWDVSSPSWTPVNNQTELPKFWTTSFHSMSVSIDHQTLTIWDPTTTGSVTNYSLADNVWLTLPSPLSFQLSERDLQTATDSTTGKIYTPLGYEGNKMLIYNPAQATPGAASVGAAPDGTSPAGLGTFSAEVMPGGYQKGSTGYSFVWSEVRKRFILFGGRNVIGAYMWEYHPSTKNWTELVAYNGTKMILFGGRINDTVTQGSIYILDLPKRVWTKGPNVNPSQYRSHMACGVSGDNFLA
ncbi:hypothetical protein BGX33_000393 [Mortierella sp. NVP41]|nr:hypothetical protein BGX33_000393 [Mortierella sp. NVP41]